MNPSAVTVVIRDTDAQEDHVFPLPAAAVPNVDEPIRFEVRPGEWRSGRGHRSFAYGGDGARVVLEILALEDDEEPE